MGDLISENKDLTAILEEMIEVSDYLWQRGWAERNAGNLSVDVTGHLSGQELPVSPDTGRKLEYTYPGLANRFFLVTGSGRRFRDLPKDPPSNACILKISEDGGEYELVWGGRSGPDFKPTSEFPAHLRLHEYLCETDAAEKVVLHTHPIELITLTHLPEYGEEAALNQVLWCVHPEVKYNLPKGIGFVPYAVPGSEELAQATLKCFQRGYPLVLWEIHGSVSRAKTPMEAFDLVDIANKAASIALMCRNVGHMPTGLSKEKLDELVRIFGLEE